MRPSVRCGPAIPVVAVTGTNGKTTTTRLIAHLVKAGGRTPGWSSTDGIFIDGDEVETGDWSGPGGAARVLEDPTVQVAVTETARGGILLRGVGTAVNDVSVVTNISADHLGLLGVHTVEQLAEVKSVVARITKPNGWTVLNADDPLVRAMRSVSRARPWFYSPDPDNPYLDEALEAGGRAITVVDGEIVILGRGLDPTIVIDVADVPLTLAGASKVNVSNVLAATAAAIAIGVPLDAVRTGLRHLHRRRRAQCRSAQCLPARAASPCCSTWRTTRHRWQSLLEVAGALKLPGGELAVVLGTAGDRTDDAIHAMGAMAAQTVRPVGGGRPDQVPARTRTRRDGGDLAGRCRRGRGGAGGRVAGRALRADPPARRGVAAAARRAPRSRCARWNSGRRWSPRSSAEAVRR